MHPMFSLVISSKASGSSWIEYEPVLSLNESCPYEDERTVLETVSEFFVNVVWIAKYFGSRVRRNQESSNTSNAHSTGSDGA